MEILNYIPLNNSAAIIFNDITINYSKLHNKISKTSNSLLENNIKLDDRVILISNNSIDFIIQVFSLWNIGAIPVPINPNFTKNELNNIVDQVLPEKILVEENINVKLDISTNDIINFPIKNSDKNIINKINIDKNKTALILFSSGSSGKAKGIKLSFNNLISSALAQIKFLNLKKENKYLASLPFYHIGGFSIITRTLFSGGAIIIPKSIKNEDIITAIEKHKPNSISLVLTQLKRILEKNFQPSVNLNNILIGGSLIDTSLVIEAVKKGWKIIKVYGSTETCSFITAQRVNPKNLDSKSVGKVLGNNKIKIIDNKIAIKGDSVMQGYFNQQVDFSGDGYFITEDIGYIDENNELFVEGRKDDIIISGGENISLKEIEYYVNKFEKIKDSTVIGIKDKEWGEIVAVSVVSINNDLFLLSDLNDFLSGYLAKYKLPKKIFFVDQIPRNEMGKILRYALMEKIKGC
ncbi:MAG: o-succinylbenzoate--CoA ligase [Ignavibacteriales bacterium CG_4_9_14_3_um_filter_30_11]|nr:MAG: o-succinylbenzoate--CoA ligase [Ignavibacteriales bacterium CG_4_9_14_3_um_filter_30_11]